MEEASSPAFSMASSRTTPCLAFTPLFLPL